MDATLATLSQDELETELVACVEAMGALHARTLAVIGEVAARGGHRDDGCRFMSDWLVLKLDLGRDTASAWARTADALRELPVMAEAHATGRVSFDQLRLLTRIATPETEAGVLDDFGHVPVHQLQELARKHAARTRKPEDDTDRLTIRFDGDNTHRLNGVFHGDNGQRLVAAIERESQRIHHERLETKTPHSGVAVRDAEALVNMASARLADDHDADRATIVVHAPLASLAAIIDSDDIPEWLSSLKGLNDLAEFANGPVLQSDTLQRLLCDCRLQLQVDDHGRPVAISTAQRLPTPAMVRAIRRRDNHRCRFPGCGATRFLRTHHLEHWVAGGPTSWDNLLSLCPYHHRLVHEGGWTIEGDVNRTIRFLHPAIRPHDPRTATTRRLTGVTSPGSLLTDGSMAAIVVVSQMGFHRSGRRRTVERAANLRRRARPTRRRGRRFRPRRSRLRPRSGVRDEVAAYLPILHELAFAHTWEDRPIEERGTYGKAFIQVPNLWRHDARAAQFTLARRFASVAAQLLGVPSVRLYHDQALFKEAGGGRTPWHQDQPYWPLDTNKTVTMWMPLVDVAPEVGTMTFASGSHQLGDLGAYVPSDDSDDVFGKLIDDKGLELHTYGPLKAGDTTWHNGWMLHHAPQNPTGVLRAVMTVIYMADGTRVTEPTSKEQAVDKKYWLPGTDAGDLAATELNPIVWP